MLRTKSTSPKTTKVSEIVLREGDITQLVFAPVMVPNEKNPLASVNGEFVFQKKARGDTWIPLKTIPLTSLKSGEGYTLHLKSEELLKLYEYLGKVYSLRAQAGIPSGNKTWIETPFSQLGKLDYESLAEFLDADISDAAPLIAKFIKWLSTSPQAAATAQRLVDLNPNQLPDLNARVGLALLKDTLSKWRQNASNADEGEWQDLLEDRTHVLSQVFSYPLVIINSKPYLGGKGLDNKGGKFADFLAANAITHSAVIIEIKTPITPLLASREYRDDVYPFSEELSGAIAQVLNQRRAFLEHHASLASESPFVVSAAGVCCLVVAGNIGNQLKDKRFKENFELQRQALHGVTVVTYDELFRKIEDLILLFEFPAK
jgi:hypothetical protein